MPKEVDIAKTTEGKEVVGEGKVSPEQLQEIDEGKCYTLKELSSHIGFSYPWIHKLVQTGRIAAFKPLGHRWRIPASEFKKLTTTGLSPLPKPPAEKDEALAIEVTEEQRRKLETSKEKPRQKGPGRKKPWTLFDFW